MRKKIFILAFVILNSSFLIHNCFGQWEPDVRLTNASGHSYTSNNNAWSIATNGNVVHVVWYDNRYGHYEILYKRSTDGGINWGVDTRLTNKNASSFFPSIAVFGSFVHVVWEDERDGISGEIYYKHSTDGGFTWGTDTRLTNNTAYSEYPSIAVTGLHVHVVWEDYRDSCYSEIYYKRSTDGGINWEADTRLTCNTARSGVPSIAFSDSILHIVWEDWNAGNFEIYYKHSTDGGYTWGTDTRLTYNTASSLYPSIAVSGSIVNVVWEDQRDGNREIYYKRSYDAGINWGADTRLTNNTANSREPTIAFSGLLVHVVWTDNREGNTEIYYKRSTNIGINWETDTRLTNNSANSLYPSIAISGSLVHIVWRDERDGNPKIYYKRNPTGNVGIKNISTEIPSAFSLEQNYPNPFNQSTMFNLKCSMAGIVKVSVYDISGKEVATLVNEKLKAGVYSVRFDAGNLPSGIYFYRLQTENYTATKKLILLK
jgi:hypothetical protein